VATAGGRSVNEGPRGLGRSLWGHLPRVPANGNRRRLKNHFSWTDAGRSPSLANTISCAFEIVRTARISLTRVLQQALTEVGLVPLVFRRRFVRRRHGRMYNLVVAHINTHGKRRVFVRETVEAEIRQAVQVGQGGIC
jgi:hypothetical protein